MRKIRIGIVGLNFGRHIVADLIKTQKRLVEISALCDIETEKAEKIAREHGLKCRIFSDYGAMLREKDIDAVGLFTGPLGRAGMIRKAVDAGKHVMTTKPFETDSNAAQRSCANFRRRRKGQRPVLPAVHGPANSGQRPAWHSFQERDDCEHLRVVLHRRPRLLQEQPYPFYDAVIQCSQAYHLFRRME
jgi:hypothetical protein